MAGHPDGEGALRVSITDDAPPARYTELPNWDVFEQYVLNEVPVLELAVAHGVSRKTIYDRLRKFNEHALHLKDTGVAPRRLGKKDEAERILREMLRDGSKPSTDIEAQARAAGISSRTLATARKALGIQAHKTGPRSCWTMALPSQDARQAAERARPVARS